MTTPPASAPPAPAPARAVAFIDGQNLFYAAQEAFGYNQPNYDPWKLAEQVCQQRGWTLHRLHFYTGVPSPRRQPRLHTFWTAKLRNLRRRGAEVFSPVLRYRTKHIAFDADSSFRLPDGAHLPRGTALYLDDGSKLPYGSELHAELGEEKGVDVRIAVDLIRLALTGEYDVGVIFSQD